MQGVPIIHRTALAILLIAFLVVMGCASWVTRDDNTPEAYLKQAQASIRRGDYESALSKLGTALSKSPNDPDIHLSLGWLYLYTDDVPKARLELEKLSALQPDGPQTHYLRGAIFARLEQYLDAQAEYTRAIALGLDNPRLYFDAGTTENSLNESKKALTYLKTGLKKLPKADVQDRLNFLFALCSTHSRLKEFEQAIRRCDEAIKLSPNPAERQRIRDFVENMKLIEEID